MESDQCSPWEGVTDDETTEYMAGRCHNLALAISELTAWPVCAFQIMRSDEVTLHAFARAPDGRYVDVLGLHDEDGLVDQWKEIHRIELVVVPVTADLLCEQGWRHPYTVTKDDRRVARLILDDLAGADEGIDVVYLA